MHSNPLKAKKFSISAIYVLIAFSSFWLEKCHSSTDWNVNGSGNWSTASNWNPATVPNAVGLDVLLGSVITGPVAISFDQNATIGTLTYSNSNFYSINNLGFTLTFDNSPSTPSISSTIANSLSNSASIQINQPLQINANNTGSSFNFTGVISGTGPITLTGGGSVTFTGNNTYTGDTIIENGVTLNIINNNNLGSGGALSFPDTSGALSVNSSITLSRNIIAPNVTSVALISPDAGPVTLNGSISGNGSFSKIGTSTLTLTQPSTISGGITIFSTTLAISDANQLGPNSLTFAPIAGFNAPVLDVSGVSTFTPSIVFSNNTQNIIITEALANFTANGGITGSGYLFKDGPGTLTLGGAYTASTQAFVNDGLLALTGSFPVNATVTANNGGTFAVELSGVLPVSTNIVLNSGGTFDISSTLGQTITNITSASGSFVELGNQTLTLLANTPSTTLNAVIQDSGNGQLVWNSNSTLILTAVNTYSGGTTIAQGTVDISSDSNLGSSGSDVTFLNTTGELNIIPGLTLNKNIVVPFIGYQGTISLNNADVTLNGSISGNGSLIKTGTPTLILTQPSTISGGITINTNTLAISNANQLGTGTLAFGPNFGIFAPELDVSGTSTFSGPITFSNGSQNTIFTEPAANFTASGGITGSGYLYKDGTGTLNLGGTNTYNLGTTVNDGTLNLTGSLSSGSTVTVNNGATFAIASAGLPSNTNVQLSSGATFDISASPGQTLSGLTSPTGSIIELGNQTLTLTQPSFLQVDGVIQDTGSGQLIWNSNSTLALTAANTYSGGTTINQGAISISADNNLGNGGDLTFTNTGGQLLVTSPLTLNRNIVIPNVGDSASLFASSNFSINGTISGSGSLQKTGPNTVTLVGSPNTFSGGTDLVQGTLSISNANQLGNGDLTFSNGSILKVTAGATTFGQMLHFGSSYGIINVDTGAAMTFNGGSDGAGGLLIKDGPGNMTLGGTNNFSGGLHVTNGTFFLTGSLFNPTDLSLPINSSAVFDMSGSSGATLSISGVPGSTIQLGSQTLSIANSVSTFDGKIIDTGGGVVSISNPGALLFLTSNSTGNNYSSTNVSAGSIQIAGTVTNYGASPNFLVGPSGTLIANTGGQINGDVLIQGSLNLGQSAFTVSGTYEQATGSNLNVTLLNNGTSGTINVLGTATFDPNAIINVQFGPGSFTTPIQWTVFTTTGGITGSTLSINLSSPLAVVSYEFTAADLILLTLSGFNPFTTLVTQGNANAVATCVDNTTTTPGSDFANIVSYLQMQNIPFLYFAFNEMEPTAFKSLPLSQQEIFLEVQNTLSHRYVSFYSTACEERELLKSSLWFDTFGSTQTQNGGFVAPYSPVPSYTTKSVGALFGADTRLTKNFYFGGVFGYSAGFTSMHDNAGHGNIQSIYLGPYARYGKETEDISPYLDLSLLGEFNLYNTHRKIEFGPYNRTAEGDHTGQGLLFHAGGGAWIKAGKIDVSPFVNFDIITMGENSYHESGADSLNLFVESAYYQLTQAGAGVLARTCFRFRDGIFIPEIGFSIMHENRNRGAHYTAALKGTNGCTFKVKGLNPDRTLYIPEAELKWRCLKDRFTASLYYQGKYSDDFTQSELGFQLAWNF